MPIEVVHFNPRRRRPGLLGYVRPKRALNNFGDLIGPVIVDRIAAELNLIQPPDTRRLVAVGSIMKLTRPGDVVWGTGVNGKSMDVGAAPDLDVRAVRGPRTRNMLREHGTDVPEIFGDPALLWPRYWPREHYLQQNPGTRYAVGVVPNFHDRATMTGPHVIDPLGPLHEVIRDIALSDFVCGSSLHGIIIAEAFGIPARLVKPGAEDAFKYDDYYYGTGRDSYDVAMTVEEAIDGGGEAPGSFDADALFSAFPKDLYLPATEIV
jgi:pyruvyltransferase